MLIFVASLLPVSPDNVFSKIFSQAKVDKGGNIIGTEIWDKNKTIDKDYTVKAGAELVIKKGVIPNQINYFYLQSPVSS